MRSLVDIQKDAIGKEITVDDRKGRVVDVREFRGAGRFQITRLKEGGFNIGNSRRVDMKVFYSDTGDSEWITGVQVE